MDAVLARVPREEIFARTGIQFLPINTIYQLVAHVRDGLSARRRRLLLMPDLCHLFLCGVAQRRVHRRVDDAAAGRATSRQWDDALFARLGPAARR